MSVEALALVLHHSKASGTDKVVLLGIANHEGDGGAFPSIATLAKYANVDSRTVQRSLRRLEEMGEVVVHLGAGGRPTTPHGQRTNRYEVRVICPTSCDRSTAHRVTPDVDVTPDADVTCTPDAYVTPTPDVDVTPPLTPTSPEPSLNHPSESSFESSVVVDTHEADDADDASKNSSDDWTDNERKFIAGLAQRIDTSDFNGADEDAAVTQVRSYWGLNMHKPIPGWMVSSVRRRVRDRDLLHAREEVTA